MKEIIFKLDFEDKTIELNESQMKELYIKLRYIFEQKYKDSGILSEKDLIIKGR